MDAKATSSLRRDELGRLTGSDPEAITRALFDDVLPEAGVADSKSVEERFLGWQSSRTVYRGDRGVVEPLVVADLRHMCSEPGFVDFTINTVEAQNAAEVFCFMSERSRAGHDVAVPVRVWYTGRNYVVSGIDETWKAQASTTRADRGESVVEAGRSDAALSGSYRVTINYDLSLQATIEAGAYDSVADEYTFEGWSNWRAPDGSPLQTPGSGREEKELLLFHLGAHFDDGPYPATGEVEDALRSANLVAGTIHELLALGIDHPDLQREFPIYELGSVWQRSPDDLRFVAGLIADRRLRRLGLSSYLIQWPLELRILVSRP